MKFSSADRTTFLVLGCLGLIVLRVAAMGQFPYLDVSPFDFALPNYAAY